jgi:hypothetical protein
VVEIPSDIDPELVKSILASLPTRLTQPQSIIIEPESKKRRKKPNPIRISAIAVEQMRKCIGRKDVIYGDDEAIRERLRSYLLRGDEVEMPRGGTMVAYTSKTVKYLRHNNWILSVEGLQVKAIQFGDAKRWRAKPKCL